MKSLIDILTLTTDFLKQKGISSARRQAEELICDALGVRRMDLYLDFERPLTEPELDLCRKNLARRAKGEPLQYIKGVVEFLDAKIFVSPAVLIPRQETEILVDKIASELKGQDLSGKVLWDICCGSGCIGISLKKRFPELRVILSDLSNEALNLARKNCEANEVEIEIRSGDLLGPFFGEKCDFFVCNPPYISNDEYEGLEVEVKDFEPKNALVGGATGLEFYARLAAELAPYLKSGGKGWLEIGKGQGEEVMKLFLANGWKNLRFEKDWSGHDRFFFLEIE